MEENLVDMFILSPAYFNVTYMEHSMESAYTVTIPVKEMKKFKRQKDLDDFLYYNYDRIFHGEEMKNTTLQFEYYFQKRAEHIIKE